jgi:fatty-acid peroxygenase
MSWRENKNYIFKQNLIYNVKKDFSWQQYHFKKGTLVMLDIYGTNHHPDIWDEPAVFNPARFVNWKESPFNFVPQGGGDHYMGHRCAGEWVTLLVMKESLNFLTNKLSYVVPEQDLSYSMARIPTMPKSGFIMHNIQRTEID